MPSAFPTTLLRSPFDQSDCQLDRAECLIISRLDCRNDLRYALGEITRRFALSLSKSDRVSPAKLMRAKPCCFCDSKGLDGQGICVCGHAWPVLLLASSYFEFLTMGGMSLYLTYLHV